MPVLFFFLMQAIAREQDARADDCYQPPHIAAGEAGPFTSRVVNVASQEITETCRCAAAMISQHNVVTGKWIG